MRVQVESLIPQLQQYIHILSEEIGCRTLGSEGNKRAVAFLNQKFSELGLDVIEQPFLCPNWSFQQGSLQIGQKVFPLLENPQTPPCWQLSPAVAASTEEELVLLPNLTEQILVIHGELTVQPYFPKEYPFVQFEEQQRIISLIEQKNPAAVVCISHSNDAPAHMFIDDNFLIPSVTLPYNVGMRLLSRINADPYSMLRLILDTDVQPSQGANLIARINPTATRQVMVCAHVDTAHRSPGALDNAAGLAAMLGIAAMTPALPANLGVSFVAFNGEEHCSAIGEVVFQKSDFFANQELLLVVNIDSIGYQNAATTFFSANTTDEFVEFLQGIAQTSPAFTEVAPWYEGDHSIYMMQGIPVVALTSEGIHGLMWKRLHTAKDTKDLVSAERIIDGIELTLRIIEWFCK